MGKIQIDHTGSGGGITLSSDGTDLLLDGSAVGGSAVGGSTGVDFNDNVKIRLGTGNDAELFFDATNLNIDTAGDIILDSSDGDWKFKDDGTEILKIQNVFTDAHITLTQQDRDLLFRGNDGGSTITALTLDMSDAGTAIFNHDIKLADYGTVKIGTGEDLQLMHNSATSFIDNYVGHLLIRNFKDDKDITRQTDDGSGGTTTYLNAEGSTGEVQLYHYGSQKLATKSTGIQTTGTVNVNGAYTLPTSDGSANQVLTTDGSGAVTFADAGGGASSNTGTGNFIGGTNAGAALQSGGQYNTLLGQEAGNDVTTGDFNLASGYSAGSKLTTGGNNVMLGAMAME